MQYKGLLTGNINQDLFTRNTNRKQQIQMHTKRKTNCNEENKRKGNEQNVVKEIEEMKNRK